LPDAIETASSVFTTENQSEKALVIITDGENHEGDVIAAAQKAAKFGMRNFTVGGLGRIGQSRVAVVRGAFRSGARLVEPSLCACVGFDMLGFAARRSLATPSLVTDRHTLKRYARRPAEIGGAVGDKNRFDHAPPSDGIGTESLNVQGGKARLLDGDAPEPDLLKNRMTAVPSTLLRNWRWHNAEVQAATRGSKR
jgi:hypothetical protein